MRDMNFIQALEKAVKEKYGEEATYNPKQFWDQEKEKEYLEEVKKTYIKENKNLDSNEKVEIDGVLLSKKLINKNIAKECSFCKKYSFSKKDDLYLNKFNACYRCYLCELEGKKNG
jgi:hypothetical protein